MVGAEKTGVFLCTCDKKLNLNFKEVAGEIKNKVKFVEIVDRLCTPEGQGYIAQHLRWRDERRPEKLVIAACNTKTKTFDELLKKYEFDRKNMILENIREHCTWVHKERNEATEKARAIVKCGVVKARYLKKPEPIKVTIDRSIALVGSQGLATAPMLEKFGASLHLIRSEGYLKRGFKAAKFNFYPASEVLGISGRLGNFKVTLKRKKYIDMQKCISCDACVAVCPKKAIYSPEDALFSSYAISEKCDKCEACIKVCQVDAVSLEEKTEEIKVGQVLYSSDCTAVLRAASNLTDKERESLIRTDLKKCANAGLKEKKLNITGCSYCNAACAYGAISYGDVDELSCVGCGICISACPQGVPQLHSLPEEEMFSLIEVALDTELSPKILLFSCREHGRAALQAAGIRKIDYPAATTLLVPCIGMVSDAHILRAFDLGAEGVLLLGCKECMYGNGASEAAKTAEFCRQLMGALGAEKERIKIIDGDADAPQKFAYAVSNFVRSLNSMPALGLGKKKAAELDDLLKGEIPERKMLLRIVQSLSKKLGIKSRDIKGNYAFGDLVVDYNKCTLCGACASLCSTEALTSTPEDLPTITFTHAYCTACGICEKICPEKALKVEKILDIERFVNPAPEEVKVELVKCKNCGKAIMAATAYKKLSSMLEKEKAEFLGLCRECRLHS